MKLIIKEVSSTLLYAASLLTYFIFMYIVQPISAGLSIFVNFLATSLHEIYNVK